VTSRGGIEVFFVTHLSQPVTPAQLQAILRPLGAPLVRRAAKNLRELCLRHPGLAVISVRELFAGVESDLRAQALDLFRKAEALQPYGMEALAGESKAAKPVVGYGGPFPERRRSVDLHWFFARMQEMQATAAAVLREGMAVSSTHIVISARRGDVMTITAANTDKFQVHLFSQTPLVMTARKGFVYYGDRQYPPSSEAASHWHLHQALPAAGGACLLHFHHAGLRDAVHAGEVLHLGSLRIPCMTPLIYGTREQGLAMAQTLRRHRTRAVTVAEHGTWFAAKDFASALKLARGAVRRFSRDYPAQTTCCRGID